MEAPPHADQIPTDTLDDSPVPPACRGLLTPEDVAALTVHAWKILRRSERDTAIPRVVGRNAEQILTLLQECAGVELISYHGRRLDAGARVEVLETISDEEENLVVEEHEPEIQVGGAQIRRAVLSVGRGRELAP